MAYYVFRINYDEYYESIRREILNLGVLRQGWGAAGMRVDQGYEVFRDAWRKEWGYDDSDEAINSRYNNLVIMTEMQPGDYIVIPKTNVKENYVCRSFIIARCKGKYRFEVFEGTEDFGHIIEVENVFSCSYDKNINSQTIAKKFTAYQSPVNRVRNADFIEAVDELVTIHDNEPELFVQESSDLIEMVSSATHNSRKGYLESIVGALRKLENHKFEDIISELFEKSGYKLTANNQYDRQGGDVDLVFESFSVNSLMHNIYEICDTVMPHIYVQAKKKTGIDTGDEVGVEQLIKMQDKIPEKNAILMVINLTDEYSSEAQEKAKEKGIILIDGMTFASLLVRYGIEVI